MRTILLAAAAAALWAATPARAQHDTVTIDSALARSVRTPQAPFFWRLSPVRSLPGGRFYTLVGRSRTQEGSTAVLLCEGTGRAESTTVACVPLRTPGRPSGPSADERAEYHANHGDFDRDAEFEVSVYLGYGVESYTGAVEHNQFYVIDTEPTLRVAASAYVYIRHAIGYEPELTFEDLNADEHPDIVVRGAACRPRREEGPPIGCRPIVRRLIWNARTDSWAAAASRRP